MNSNGFVLRRPSPAERRGEEPRPSMCAVVFRRARCGIISCRIPGTWYSSRLSRLTINSACMAAAMGSFVTQCVICLVITKHKRRSHARTVLNTPE